MIHIALGANLPSSFGSPEETLEAAIAKLQGAGLEVLKRSRIWLTAPVPASDQPWYRNMVISVKTEMGAEELMALLLSVEEDFGRVRAERNAPRSIDLDIIAYDEDVQNTDLLSLPHPRMHQRAFVLYPLAEIAPEWQHPVLGLSVSDMIEQLPQGQDIKLLDEAAA